MKIRLAGRTFNSMVNGRGLRYVLFAQGCRHNCKGCFSTFTHDFNGGEEFTTDEIIKEILEDPITSGVTFSGGDPFEQPMAFAEIASAIRSKSKKNIWCYTGYTFEEIKDGIEKDRFDWAILLSQIDVLVDGKFEMDKCIDGLRFKGSSNQRIINVSKTFAKTKIVEEVI